MKDTSLTRTILWVLAAAYAVALIANITLGLAIPTAVVLLISVAFVLLHGAVRYRWTGIAAFIVISLVVSNIFENTSILTGFPFGHYHYTDALGPKVLLVPVLIGVAYFTSGYLAWALSNVLVGDVRRDSSAFTTFAVPFIAGFFMVMWDVTLDPRASTLQHWWIWEQGGGYFGVPFTNYLGWFLTVYVFYQLFALFLRYRPVDSEPAPAVPKSYYAQAIFVYAVLGFTPVLNYMAGGTNSAVTDAAGVVWQTRAIIESMATVTLYTMLFGAAISAVKLWQAPAAALVASAATASPATVAAAKPGPAPA